MLERLFQLSQHRTTVVRELLAGVATFLTMAYILFVNPQILSRDFAGDPTGLDPGAVLLATSVAAAAACLLMGLWANYPIALAPGMGQNVFFVTVVMALAAEGVESPWRAALAIVFVSGALFLILSLAGVREAILDALSPSLRNSAAVGIGLFIAFIGLKNGDVIISHPATLVTFNHADIVSSEAAVFWGGILTMAALSAWKFRSALLAGIAVSAVLAMAFGKVAWPESVIGLPEFERTAILQLDFVSLLRWSCVPLVLIFLFMDMFDTLGTLVGVAEQAEIIQEDGKLPRATEALSSDAVGTIVGACLGTSTVTSYIESAAGVEQGGRTGLTALTVAALFVAALWFSPLVAVIAQYPPVTAPALVLVGAMMARNVVKIEWDDPSEAIPAFLVVLGIPLFYSIGDGLALGFVSYPIIKVASGRAREVRWLMYLLAPALLAYFLLVKPLQ